MKTNEAGDGDERPMTCEYCGASNVEGAVSCAFCGVALRARPAAEGAPVSSRVQSETSLAAVQRNHAVGGWLLFFCVGLTFLAPSALLLKVLATNDSFLRYYDLALAAFSVLVGINVWAVKPRALLLVAVYFLTQLATDAGSTVVVAYFWLQRGDTVRISHAFGSLTWHVLINVLVVGAWCWYFSASKRVKATLGVNLWPAWMAGRDARQV